MSFLYSIKDNASAVKRVLRKSKHSFVREQQLPNGTLCISSIDQKIQERIKPIQARPLQEFVLEQIRKAGGFSRVCSSEAEARDFIRLVWETGKRGHFVAIELKRGNASSESDLKRRVIAMIRRDYPNAWIYKSNDRFTSGIPDLIICLG